MDDVSKYKKNKALFKRHLQETFPKHNKNYRPSRIEIERRERIKLSLAAFAYELKNESIMSDHEFDALAKEINPRLRTGHQVLDKFFATEFETDTGVWIRSHPELDRLNELYQDIFLKKIN